MHQVADLTIYVTNVTGNYLVNEIYYIRDIKNIYIPEDIERLQENLEIASRELFLRNREVQERLTIKAKMTVGKSKEHEEVLEYLSAWTGIDEWEVTKDKSSTADVRLFNVTVRDTMPDTAFVGAV